MRSRGGRLQEQARDYTRVAGGDMLTADRTSSGGNPVQPFKIATVVLWLACLATVFTRGDSWLEVAGRTLFWITAATHLVEYLFYYRSLKRLGESMWGHFLQVMLFGIVHWREQKPRIPPV